MQTTMPTAFAPVPTGFRLPASNPPYPPAVGSALARAFHPCSDRLRFAALGRTTPDRTQPQPTEHVARTIDVMVQDNRVMHRQDRQHRAHRDHRDQHDNLRSTISGISCVVGVQEGDAKGPRYPQYSSNVQTPCYRRSGAPIRHLSCGSCWRNGLQRGHRHGSNTLLTVIPRTIDLADTVQTRKSMVCRSAGFACISSVRPHDVKSRDRVAACSSRCQGIERSAARRRHEAIGKFIGNRPPLRPGRGWWVGGKSAASTQSTSSLNFAAFSEKLVAPRQQTGPRKSCEVAPQILRRRMPEGPTPQGYVGPRATVVPVAGHDRVRRQAPVAPDTPMNLNCPSVPIPARTRSAGSRAPETVGRSPQGQGRYPRVWTRHKVTELERWTTGENLAGRQKAPTCPDFAIGPSVTAEVIEFPRDRAKLIAAAPDLKLAHACAVASGEALIALAAEYAAARERGDLCPAMQQVAALAAIFGDE
jgi:hypothetical protein